MIRGGVMSISYDITATLRSEMKHHEPIVLTYAIDHVVTTGGGCTARGKCWYEEVCPTLKSGGTHAVCALKRDEREDIHREEIF